MCLRYKGIFYLSFIYTTAFLLMFFKSILFILVLICVNARHLKNENTIKLVDTVNQTKVVEQLFNLTKLNYQSSITPKLNILMYEIEI